MEKMKETRYLLDVDLINADISLLDDGTLEELKKHHTDLYFIKNNDPSRPYLILDDVGNEIGYLEPYP